VYRPEVSEIDFDKPFYTFLYRKIFDLKNVFSDSVDRSVLEPNASFINGILLGERSAIPLSLKEAFRRTGMVHILAISGYNVTIIVSLIYALLLLILRRSKAFWFALLGIFAFTVLTGASASVVRAAIMGSLVILAHKEGRIYSSSRALAFTAALMVAFDPLVIQEDIGFLLSFAATLGMLYLVPVFDKYVRRIPGFYGTKEAAVTTLSAQIMVLPLLLYFFGSVSPLSVVVNIMVLPLIPLAMLLGFVVGLVGIVSLNLAIILGYLPWLVTTVQIKIIEFFGKFEMWDFSFNLALMIFVYGLILYILIRNGELT
jgi:competence protein ComEC